MGSTKDVEAAVESAEEWLAMLDSVPVTACGVLRYPPICATEVQAFRTILASRAADLAEYRRGKAEAERTIRSLQDGVAALTDRLVVLEALQKADDDVFDRFVPRPRP